MDSSTRDRLAKLIAELKELILVPQYDEKFGDERLCVCGHAYYRHFDTYEDMRPVGCKYCPCDIFTDGTKME